MIDSIDRNKLISSLNDWALQESPTWYADKTAVEYTAYDMQKMIYRTIQDAMTAVEDMPSANGWIPCTEKLPEKDGAYLTTYEVINGRGAIGIMSFGIPDTYPKRKKKCFYQYDSEYGDFERNSVVAWMPLPEPYREVE